jgi:hypothetical protein
VKEERKTYGEAWVFLEGKYTLSQLRELVAHLERLNAENQKHMEKQNG